MAFTLADAYVRIRPDGSKFGAELSGDVEKSSRTAGVKAGKQFHAGVGEGISGMAKTIAAGFAGAALISFFRDSIAEGRESVKVQKLTAAAIASTGGAAKVSAGHINDLANKLSLMSGVDDEVIQGSENLLLTFTKVHNEAGRGNDIFDQATLATLNMSRALGKDLNSATTIVGKALNDPIRGLTSLTKIGVTFTDQQRAQIKAMVESGNTMGAQKIILEQLRLKYEGAAAAAASPADKARVAWKNFEEMVGKALLPTLDRLLSWGVQNQGWLGPTISALVALGFAVAAVKVATIAYEAAVTVAQVATATWAATIALANTTLLTWLGVQAIDLAAWVGRTAAVIANTVAQVGSTAAIVASAVASGAAAVAYGVVTVATYAWATATAVLEALLALPVLAIAGIVIAILALIGAIVFLATQTHVFQNIWDASWGAIKQAAVAVYNWFVGNWPFLLQIITTPFQLAVGIIARAWGAIQASTGAAYNFLRSVFGAIGSSLVSLVGNTFNAVANTINGAWNRIKAFTGSAWAFLGTAFAAISNGIRSVGSAFAAGANAVAAAWQRIADTAKAPVRFVIDTVVNKAIIGTLNTLSGIFGIPKIPNVGVPFAAGGQVPFLPGSEKGKDSVLAMLTPGEGVLTTAEMDKLGGPAGFAALRQQIRGYSIGGVIGGAISDALGGISKLAGGLVGLVTDPAKTVTSAVEGPINAIADHFPHTKWLDVVTAFPKKIMSQMITFVKSKIGSVFGAIGKFFGGGGGAPSGALESWILTAEAITGVPASWTGPLNTLIMRESGGNPNAINLSDSNAQAGHPSQGLMQTIPSTFNAYAIPGLGGITNPIANIVAGIRYILARYGSIFNVQQADASRPPMGYGFGGLVKSFDKGGLLMPGATLALNGTGRPESVGGGIVLDPGSIRDLAIAIVQGVAAVQPTAINIDGEKVAEAISKPLSKYFTVPGMAW